MTTTGSSPGGRWPVLQNWLDAPLRHRLLDKENCVRGQHPHGGASVIMPYLPYLSLVEGVGLDYPVLLVRWLVVNPLDGHASAAAASTARPPSIEEVAGL